MQKDLDTGKPGADRSGGKKGISRKKKGSWLLALGGGVFEKKKKKKNAMLRTQKSRDLTGKRHHCVRVGGRRDQDTPGEGALTSYLTDERERRRKKGKGGERKKKRFATRGGLGLWVGGGGGRVVRVGG